MLIFAKTPLIQGFAACAPLIMAVGAQNAFVIKQGLKGEHLFLTATLCVVFDALLISLGVSSVGWFIIANPKLATTFKIAGALFLVGYALKSWVSAWSIQGMDINPSNSPSSRWPTILTLLAFTFLNPHTYVDTLLLIGSLGAQFPAEEHLAFILGAVLASGLWFYSLTYGAQFLTPYFKHWRTWQILDIIIGIIMMALALNLIWPLLG